MVIPFKIKEIVGRFNINDLVSLSLEEYINIFNRNILHRFNDINEKCFIPQFRILK